MAEPTSAAQSNPAPRAAFRGRLFRKYFLLILALVSGALLVSGAISVYFSYQENKSALASVQHEKAVAAASRIDVFVRQIEQQVGFAALPQLGAEEIEQRRIEFLKLLKQAQAVTDIAQLDRTGKEVLAVSRLAMDVAESSKDRSRDPAFLGAKPDKTWFGPVYFRKETEPYMAIAVRSRGEAGAVTVAEVNLKFIWDVITRIKIGDKGKAYVVDGGGHLVADPDIGLVLRKTDYSGLAHVKAALSGPVDAEELARVARDLSGVEVLTAFASIEPLGWKVFVEQPVAEVYVTLKATMLRTGALMVAGLLLSALMALVFARGLVRPIRTLQEGAQRIGEGDLSQRIAIHTGDELEALAGQFNDMSAKLTESYGSLERKVEERTAELKETLEQQTAISGILRVISSSPTNVQPVLDAVAESAVRLCHATLGALFTIEGNSCRIAAQFGVSPELFEHLTSHPILLGDQGSIAARAVAARETVQIEDAMTDPHYARRDLQQAGGYRTLLGVPIMREGVPIGVMSLSRTEVRAFTDTEIKLVASFADQAAIAIENVRLFNETREALERQTATAEILRVISGSITDVQPVFDAIVSSCQRLFQGRAVTLVLPRGEQLESVAFADDGTVHGDNSGGFLQPWPFDRDSGAGACILDSRVIAVADTEEGTRSYARMRSLALALGYRSALFVPLLREGSAIGCVAVLRASLGEFSDKEIALANTFADQAVIAIENVRLFNEIQEKSRQLEIADKHKSEFLANMSHELRTPLNAIIGFSEVLLERMFGELNEKQDDYLKDIHSSGKHLLSLINDILDLSKIEAGRMELDLGTFDAASALANAMTLVRERAQRHGITLTLEADPLLGEIRADERKFKQILLNLLTNAVKFTPDGGKVGVHARLAHAVLEVAVSDTGIGIATDDLEAVFEEFRQVGRHYTNKQEGTGLGLALTKRFVELHGGTVRLESEPGKGSTFTFTIPSQP
ncbi:MAG: GAF domain-containing protein [Betaproteobacteria bacterium]|nr:GAF domain-containing protein [Betaproteobacteria bacterium]